MAARLDHPDDCGCMVCRRRRERLQNDPLERERDTGEAEFHRLETSADSTVDESGQDAAPVDDPGSERVVVEHRHHVEHEHTREVERRVEHEHHHDRPRQPREPRRERPRRPRRPRGHHSILRTILVGAVLVWMLHSFYPDLDVPGVPGVACLNQTSGTATAAGLSIPMPSSPPFLSPPLTPTSPYGKGLGGKVEDLTKVTIGSAVKKVFLLTAGTALHAVGSTFRAMVAHPPSTAGIRVGLRNDAAAVGRVVGFVAAAFKGSSVDSLADRNVEGAAAVGDTSCGCPSQAVPATSTGPNLPGLDAEQSRNARVIISTGQGMSVPSQGLVVAIAAASQESGIRNLHGGDRDSQGLFQMRPSMGWGTVAQVTDPVYASRKFFTVLNGVAGWQMMSVTQAAQAVERSGFPQAYAQWEDRARKIVAAVTGAGSDSGMTLAAADIEPASVDGPVTVDGNQVSAITARQLKLAELDGHINLTVMRGGYGGNQVSASGTSHNYPGVADISPGGIAVERLLREHGFAAWARNVPGRSSVGSGVHVHAVSLLETKDSGSPQVYGSWAGHKDGLGGGPGSDPAPHYPWVPNLAARVGGVSLNAATAASCAPTGGGGGVVATASIATRTNGSSFGVASFNILGASHTGTASADRRLPHAVQVLAKHGPDVVGFQEMQGRQARLFDRLAGGTYARWSGSNDTDNSIAWRRGTFAFISGRKLSVPYFDGHPRQMPAVQLKYLPTGQTMTFLNVHNPADTATYHHQARFRAAALRVELPFLRGQSGPVFWTGDMNAHDPFYRAVRAGSSMRGQSANRYGGIDWLLHSRGQQFGPVTTDQGPLVHSATDHPYVQATVPTVAVGGN